MRYLIAFLLSCSLFAQTYTLGDSHAQACYLGTPLAVPGATYQDLSQGLLEGRGRFASQLKRMKHPETIILAFGTNDAMSFNPVTFRAATASVVDVLRINYPQARLVIWGPPAARGPRIRLDLVVQHLQELADAQHIRFIDRRPITPDAFKADGVHLTLAGYALLMRYTPGALP